MSTNTQKIISTLVIYTQVIDIPNGNFDCLDAIALSSQIFIKPISRYTKAISK